MAGGKRLSDEELLVGVTELGEIERARVFKELHSRHVGMLRSRVYSRFTQDWMEVNEIVQDAFLKAFMNIHRYDPSRLFRAWLCVICDNAAIDYLRVFRGRCGFVEVSEFDGYEDVVFDCGELDRYLGMELDRYVMDYLSGYEDEVACRVFMMHYGGVSYSRISEELGIPIGTVKIMVFRVRNRLQELLRAYGYVVNRG